MNSRVATIGLGAFLLADVVLVALALRPPRASSDAPSAATTRVTSSGASTSTPGATTKGTSTKTPGASVDQPVQRMIVGADAKNAWRATVGACDGGGSTLQVTKDGGKTWAHATSPNKALARIQPLRQGAGFAYAAGADCMLEQWTTKDDGATWTGPKAIVGGWAREIDKAAVVITPNDPASQPCGGNPVLDLSRTSADQAEALCANGDVVVTNNGGTSWEASGKASGAIALANRVDSGSLSTYAARIEPSCAGVQIVKVTAAESPKTLACVETTEPPEPGQVGLSATTDAGWLVVGTKTWTAGADLKSWSPA